MVRKPKRPVAFPNVKGKRAKVRRGDLVRKIGVKRPRRKK